MIYLFIELSGFKQLQRLRPEFVDRMVTRVTGLVEYAGGRAEQEDSGTLLFSIDPEGKEPEAIAELIRHAYEVLLEKQRELQGFVMVAEQVAKSNTPFPVLGRLRSTAMLADRSDSLWFGLNLWNFLGGGFVGERSGELVRITGSAVGRSDGSDDLQAFFVRPQLVEQITKSVESHLRADDEVSWIRICAPPAAGLEANLVSSLSGFSRDETFSGWTYLGTGRDSLSALEPLLEGIRSDFLSAVPELLSTSERKLWEQRVGILNFACPDHAVEDFFSIYSLYLLAYLRFMKRRRLPAVLICPLANRYPATTIHLLSRLLTRLSGFGKLILICVTSDDGPLGELEKTPHNTISVTPLDSKEIGERLDRYPQLASIGRERVEEATERQPLFLYHACLLGRLSGRRGIGVSMELLGRRDAACRRILYVTYATRGLLNSQGVADLLADLGLPDEVYRHEFTELTRMGFLDERSGGLVVEDLGRLLAGEFTSEGLDRQIADYCHSLWRSGRLSVTHPEPPNPERIGGLFWFLSRNGGFDQALLVFIDLMNRLLEQHRVDEALHYLEQENLFRMNLSTEEMRRRDFFLELTAFRAAVLLEAREQADLRLVRLKEMQVAGEWERAILDSASAQHHYAAFERKLALEAAKRSLIAAQTVDSGMLECKANIEIGLTMLATVRFEEAEEYFSLARAAVSVGTAQFQYIRSLTFEAITHYLYGNIPKAISSAEEAGGIAAGAARRDWQRLSLLLRGRCYFTLGMYEEAAKVFRSGVLFCRIYPNEDASKVFSAWEARALSYGDGGNPWEQFESLQQDAEVLLFMSEHAAETGNFSRATELIEESLELQRREEDQYVPSESIPWSSGFAPIEDRALRTDAGRGVLYFTSKAVRAYLKGLGNEVDEAITEFTRLVREDRLSEHDPNNHFYYYLHSRVVPHGEGELLVDRLTLLSKALKHVQERATRIDDVKKRQSFLHRNRWNHRLFEDAKSLKLM